MLWAASIQVRHFLRRYMPSNILLDRIRTRRGLRWGVPAMVLALPYFAVAYWCSTLIEDGGPGWLNIIVLIGIWNAFKMLAIGPISLLMLAAARLRERRARNDSKGDVRDDTPVAESLAAR